MLLLLFKYVENCMTYRENILNIKYGFALIFLHNICSKLFSVQQICGEIHAETHAGLYVTSSLNLSDLSEHWNGSTIFRIIFQRPINFFLQVLHYFMYTDGRTERQELQTRWKGTQKASSLIRVHSIWLS